ncbi:SrtB family sortase [Lachnospiraceae bacterium]|nr:SrtB family sortase [Lachnospiraceae bacterium]
MGKVYCIGKFQFDSYDKYQEALDDIEKIRYISKKMDINEPGVAQRLYTLIREGKIIFKSAVGDDYLLYLSDMVAEDYRILSKTSFRKNLSNKVRQLSPGQIVGAVCMAGAVVCFLVFLGSEYRDQQRARELERLKNEQEISAASDWLSAKLMNVLQKDETQAEEAVQAETETVDNEVYAADFTEAETKGPQVLPEYERLYEANADFAGWISVAGTDIDYPVMQAVSESSDFYLNHDFNGTDDINGSIFLDSRNDLQNPNDNMIVYGHNMKSGMMFGGLKEYLDKNYWLEHKIITFDTIFQKAQYEVVAVCLSKVEGEEAEGFKYYDFIDAGNKKAFKRYVKNIESLNILGEPVELSYGDQLLTLSTCNNYTKDGRLFLVAKKCENQ